MGGGEGGESALVTMSTLTEEGVGQVKQVACDRLLNSRVEVKLKVGGRSGRAGGGRGGSGAAGAGWVNGSVRGATGWGRCWWGGCVRAVHVGDRGSEVGGRVGG